MQNLQVIHVSIIIPHMVVVVVAVVGSDADVAEKSMVLIVVVTVSVQNVIEELTVTCMEIATIWEPIAILLVRITILLLPSPTC